MNNTYETPKMSIFTLSAEDVIVTSGAGGTGGGNECPVHCEFDCGTDTGFIA